ncbi:hypothetical protein LUZ61_006019 [Rhynchospora tenuis]|uniref:Uncharacterized protein n=1 Tax=Rhynchospora tenuis TaxID=198213 RepID=A0AAD5ZR06_9POAL|nr:hypothetical protein LUZ61_006019 [Rhynchospora tenuis]
MQCTLRHKIIRDSVQKKEKLGQQFGCVRVLESNVAIRESFGKQDGVLQPGCYLVPCSSGKTIAGFLNIRDQQLDVRCETKTKDNLTSYAPNVICGRIPQLSYDGALQQKNATAEAVREQLEEAITTYGYEIIHTLIEDVKFDANGKRIINETHAGRGRPLLKRLRLKRPSRSRLLREKGVEEPGWCTL